VLHDAPVPVLLVKEPPEPPAADLDEEPAIGAA